MSKKFHFRALNGIDIAEHRIILDGEMLVWDPASERYLPFGTLKTAALGEYEHHEIRVLFSIFGLQTNPRRT